MDFTEKENKPGLMIFIDFRKPFDTLEWNCLDPLILVMNLSDGQVPFIKIFKVV